MKQSRVILILILIILLLILGGFIGKEYYDGKLDDKDTAYKVLMLENDELEQINETQYRKLVADTLTKKELNKIIDELGIELAAKPKVIIQTVVEFRDAKPDTVDVLTITKDSITIEDHYPQKEGYFVKYENTISIKDSTSIGKFTLAPVDISIVLSQREDGIFESDIKVPEFMQVASVDIQALPLEPPTINNFGWLLGGGVGKDFRTDETFFKLSGGIRIKKFYVDVGASTNETIDIGAKVEF